MKNIQNSKKNKIWIITFALVGTVMLVQLIVAGVLASQGEELNILESKAGKIVKENQQLQAELSSKASLQELSGKAQELGFIKQGSIVYIDLTHSVAALPRSAWSTISR